jgi:hypothetical protein
MRRVWNRIPMSPPAIINAAEAPAVMPRRLAIRLLHEAQIAGPAGFEAQVLARAEPELVVDVTAADTAGTRERQLAELDAAGWRRWAVFRYRGERSADPAAAEFAGEPWRSHPRALLLTASLAIKGVLQMHAWSLAGGSVIEHELQICD